MRRSVTRKKVEQFVLARMGDREQMEMHELVPETVEQLLLFAYVYVYGQDGSSAFQLQRNRERVIFQIGPFRFDNHTVVRANRRKDGMRNEVYGA